MLADTRLAHDILYALGSVDLTVAPADGVLSGEVVVIACVAHHILHVVERHGRIGLQPQGHDACHDGGSHRRAALCPVGTVHPLHPFCHLTRDDGAVPRRYDVHARSRDGGLGDVVERGAVAREGGDVVQHVGLFIFVFCHRGVLHRAVVAAQAGIGTIGPDADDAVGTGPVACRHLAVAVHQSGQAQELRSGKADIVVPEVDGSTVGAADRQPQHGQLLHASFGMEAYGERTVAVVRRRQLYFSLIGIGQRGVVFARDIAGDVVATCRGCHLLRSPLSVQLAHHVHGAYRQLQAHLVALACASVDVSHVDKLILTRLVFHHATKHGVHRLLLLRKLLIQVDGESALVACREYGYQALR